MDMFIKRKKLDTPKVVCLDQPLGVSACADGWPRKQRKLLCLNLSRLQVLPTEEVLG